MWVTGTTPVAEFCNCPTSSNQRSETMVTFAFFPLRDASRPKAVTATVPVSVMTTAVTSVTTFLIVFYLLECWPARRGDALPKPGLLWPSHDPDRAQTDGDIDRS